MLIFSHDFVHLPLGFLGQEVRNQDLRQHVLLLHSSLNIHNIISLITNLNMLLSIKSECQGGKHDILKNREGDGLSEISSNDSTTSPSISVQYRRKSYLQLDFVAISSITLMADALR